MNTPQKKKPRNVMDIFKYLDKSNCGKCGEKTCLAFASAVFQGKRNIEACPSVDKAVYTYLSLGKDEKRQNFLEKNQQETLEFLKGKIRDIDLAKRAEALNAKFSNNRLTLKMLGKDFSVDQKGEIYSDIHVNQWVAAPFFYYVLHGKGIPVSGEWITFRELKDGMTRINFFQKRCEEPMKKLADIYTDLFDDIVRIFGGKKVEELFESDISLVLHPLPLVPMLICYWKPEDGLGSSLNIFFDKTADQNLSADTIFTLGTGMAQMFEKIAHKHGFHTM